jgi:hypothetical protein
MQIVLLVPRSLKHVLTRAQTHARPHKGPHTHTQTHSWHLCVHVCTCVLGCVGVCACVCVCVCARTRSGSLTRLQKTPASITTTGRFERSEGKRGSRNRGEAGAKPLLGRQAHAAPPGACLCAGAACPKLRGYCCNLSSAPRGPGRQGVCDECTPRATGSYAGGMRDGGQRALPRRQDALEADRSAGCAVAAYPSLPPPPAWMGTSRRRVKQVGETTNQIICSAHAAR